MPIIHHIGILQVLFWFVFALISGAVICQLLGSVLPTSVKWVRFFIGVFVIGLTGALLFAFLLDLNVELPDPLDSTSFANWLTGFAMIGYLFPMVRDWWIRRSTVTVPDLSVRPQRRQPVDTKA